MLCLAVPYDKLNIAFVFLFFFFYKFIYFVFFLLTRINKPSSKRTLNIFIAQFCTVPPPSNGESNARFEFAVPRTGFDIFFPLLLLLRFHLATATRRYCCLIMGNLCDCVQIQKFFFCSVIRFWTIVLGEWRVITWTRYCEDVIFASRHSINIIYLNRTMPCRAVWGEGDQS